MPSILQQQLQQVSSTWGTSTGKQKGKPSLLYTAQEASDVDVQTLFELAQEGASHLQIGNAVILSPLSALGASRSS